MKLAFFTILSLSCHIGFAQLPAEQNSPEAIVGRCMAGTNILAQLAYQVTELDTIYTFSMQNQHDDDRQECSIRFSGRNNIVSSLYNTLKGLIIMRNKKRRDYSTTMAISGKLVVFETSRLLGNTSVTIYLPQGSNTLTEWQLDRLFGK